MGQQAVSQARMTISNGHGTEFAINKTRGLAFSRNGDGEWRSVDPKSVSGLAEMERVSHVKIGDNWFSIYRADSQ